jgi:hypothetical protein
MAHNRNRRQFQNKIAGCRHEIADAGDRGYQNKTINDIASLKAKLCLWALSMAANSRSSSVNAACFTVPF